VEMWKSAQTGSPEASIFHQQKSAEKNAEMLTIGVMAAALNFPLENFSHCECMKTFPLFTCTSLNFHSRTQRNAHFWPTLLACAWRKVCHLQYHFPF